MKAISCYRFSVCFTRYLALILPLFAASDCFAGDNINNDYFNIKKLARQFGEQEHLTSHYNQEYGEIDLHPCSTYGEVLGVYGFGSNKTTLLLDIAGLFINAETLLKEAKFPEDAWRSSLENLETYFLSYVQKRNYKVYDVVFVYMDKMRPIAKNLEKWRRMNNKKLPKVVYLGDCGAGGPVEVLMKTNPPNGILKIIPEFNYKLCSMSGNPDDEHSCKEWRVAKKIESVTGRYYIKAIWPDITVGPNKYNFEDASYHMDFEVAKP